MVPGPKIEKSSFSPDGELVDITYLTPNSRIPQLTIESRTAFADKACRFHALWLRDNAPDAETRSAGNGQRLITILAIPAATRIAEARIEGERLSLRFEPEGKTVAYSTAWLAAHAYDVPRVQEAGWTTEAIERWDGAVQRQVPTASFAEVSRNRSALGA